MPEEVAELFEAELRRRQIQFVYDSETGRYKVDRGDLILLVWLGNLERDYHQKPDPNLISSFVDSVLSPPSPHMSWSNCCNSVYFCLEGKLVETGPYRETLTDRVDRVLVRFDSERNLLSHILPASLRAWNVALAEATTAALGNLARILQTSTLDFHETHGVRLGFLETSIPFKSALILAPNFKEMVSPKLGWPLLAVVPDRDFLFMWDARHHDFVHRVGTTVKKEFERAPYPLTTEVVRIDDDGITAIGAF